MKHTGGGTPCGTENKYKYVQDLGWNRNNLPTSWAYKCSSSSR